MYMSEVMKNDVVGECVWCGSFILACDCGWFSKGDIWCCEKCMQCFKEETKKCPNFQKLRKSVQ